MFDSEILYTNNWVYIVISLYSSFLRFIFSFRFRRVFWFTVKCFFLLYYLYYSYIFLSNKSLLKIVIILKLRIQFKIENKFQPIMGSVICRIKLIITENTDNASSTTNYNRIRSIFLIAS